MARSGPKKATYQGVPSDKIAEAQTRWENIYVKLFRRVAGGKLSALGPKHMTPQELAKIEEYLQQLAGGGKFRVEPRNPDNLLEYAEPIPPFEVEIEGHPKPATPAEHGVKGISGGISAMEGPQQMNWNPGQPPQAPNPPYEHMPGWMRSMPPSYGHAWASQMNPSYALNALGEQPRSNGQPAPAAMYASDQIGVQQLNYTREQLTKERTEREQERKEWEKRFELLQSQINDSKEQAREAKLQAERDRLEAKLEAMQSQKSNIDPQVWIGLATAMAPVLSAMVSSGQAKAATQQEQATKAIELQMQGMNTLMSASAKKGSDLDGIVKSVAALAPVLGPVMAKWIENKSPGVQADLYSTLQEGNLTTLTTMAQFLQMMMEANGNDPWWRPMVESAIESVQQVGAQMAVQAGSKNPAVQQQAEQTKKPAMTQGQTVATMVFNNAQFPRDMKTGQWFEIIAAMHDRIDADQVSHALAQHIVNLANNNSLPELIENIFDKPEEVLNMLVGPLPIKTQAPPYVEQVINLTAHKLRTAVPVDTEADEQPEPEAAQPEPEQSGAVPFNIGSAAERREPAMV